ncbi:indole-3-glycerol-phosphate synthase [Candidatus Bathyarchaeota archaeon]|nr:indole-3-glycerol-phosphate synthase [Candidatus Bathyarchaeota archaeon]
MKLNMVDFLKTLIRDALETVRSGYYRHALNESYASSPKTSLKKAIMECHHAPVIAEIKPESPSRGKLRQVVNSAEMARLIEAGGAVGISVLTEPKHFNGSLKRLAEVKENTRLPILMKDIVVDPVQVEAALRLGADAILLIYAVFKDNMIKYSLEEVIDLAHSLNLEVLLETHTRGEFRSALKTEADLIGINNRNIRTLKVDLNTTKRILDKVDPNGRIVVSESGVEKAEDIRFLWKCGARAFLVGSAVMLAEDIQGKIRELVNAI